MPKGERRRRRRDDQGVETPGNIPAAAPDDAGVTQDPDASKATASADAVAGSLAPDEAPAAEPSHGWPDGSPPRPIALAEILVNPDLVRRPDSSASSVPRAEKSGDAAAVEQVPDTPDEPASPPSRWPVSPAAASGEETFPTEPASSVPPPSYGPEDLSLLTSHDRGQWTREPILVALLLAALLVLLFDTYFTLRLNGLSDRLALGSAVAAGATVERPWVGVDSIKTAPFANGGQPVTTVHIVNSGHEPAYDLRSNTAGSLRSAATPGPSVPAQKGQLAVTALLLPNVGGNLTFFGNTRALTPEEASNVRSGQYVLWLAGRLDYKDAHGHPHLTTFRYRYNPALNSFMATPDGNTAN